MAFDQARLRTTTAEAIADAAPAAGAAPIKAEYDALVEKFNALLAACRERGLLSLD